MGGHVNWVNYARVKTILMPVLFGHPHRAEIFKENGTIFINPRSLSFKSRGYYEGDQWSVEMLEDRLVPHIVKID